jgi:hypothetical protein
MNSSAELDKQTYFRSLKSYGPAWDAAIEYGIDMMHLERNLQLTYEQRLQNACNGIRFAARCHEIAQIRNDLSRDFILTNGYS